MAEPPKKKIADEVTFHYGDVTFKAKLIEVTNLNGPTIEQLREFEEKLGAAIQERMEMDLLDIVELSTFGSIGIGSSPQKACERFDRMSQWEMKLDLVKGCYWQGLR